MFHVAGYGSDQNVVRIEESRERVVVEEITPVEDVLAADVPVDASDVL